MHNFCINLKITDRKFSGMIEHFQKYETSEFHIFITKQTDFIKGWNCVRKSVLDCVTNKSGKEEDVSILYKKIVRQK